jgi:hypothetical protein
MRCIVRLTYMCVQPSAKVHRRGGSAALAAALAHTKHSNECTRVCISYDGMHVRMGVYDPHSLVCMGSRIASCIHVLPCLHNEVFAVLEEPQAIGERSRRSLSL